MGNFSISVCIPTYNQAQYLPFTLDSLLKQDQLPDEVWIIDDCSTDNTEEVVMSYKDRFKILHYKRNELNLGLSKNIYNSLRKPMTDAIVMLHSDDLLSPGYIKELSALLINNPKAGVAHCNIQEINEFGKPTRKRILNRSFEFENSDDALKASVKGYKVAANIIMYRKTALDSIVLPDDWPNFVEDYNVFVRVAIAKWGNVFSTKILASYRVWEDQKGLRSHRKEAELKGYIRLFEEVLHPEFERRRWDVDCLFKQRRNLALLHSVYLSEVKLQENEKKRIIQLLRRLDNNIQVNKRIRLHTLKNPLLGRIVLARLKAKQFIVDNIKRGYFTLFTNTRINLKG